MGNSILYKVTLFQVLSSILTHDMSSILIHDMMQIEAPNSRFLLYEKVFPDPQYTYYLMCIRLSFAQDHYIYCFVATWLMFDHLLLL